MLRHFLLVPVVVLDGRERVFYGKLDNWKEWISINGPHHAGTSIRRSYRRIFRYLGLRETRAQTGQYCARDTIRFVGLHER